MLQPQRPVRMDSGRFEDLPRIARLYGNKEKTGARIEVFLLRELNQELRIR